jgi:cell division septation protein DedD
MSDSNTAQQQLVTELKVSAHLMLLNTGVYCVYHTPGSVDPDATTGLPGARITLPPGPTGRGVTISAFREDGWLGMTDAAALIRVTEGPSQVLMTVYQMPGSTHEAPKLQVLRLVEGMAPPVKLPAPPAKSDSPETEETGEEKSTVSGGADGTPAPEPEIAAHLQLRGDVLARLGEWVGERGSQRWVEGFAVAPRSDVPINDIEYQAVLGRGWLSPWAEGGQYCGSRGMALPILGLRVRLRGESADAFEVELRATFTDGTEIGPVAAGEACEAASLAPLEAFQITLVPRDGEARNDATPAEQPAARKAARKAPAAVAKPQPVLKPKPAPKPVATAAAKPIAKPAAKPAAKAPVRPVAKPVARPVAKPGKGRR